MKCFFVHHVRCSDLSSPELHRCSSTSSLRRPPRCEDLLGQSITSSFLRKAVSEGGGSCSRSMQPQTVTLRLTPWG